MSELSPITEQQQVALDILRMVGNETSSAKKALEFIGSSRLNLELFRDSYYSIDAGSAQTPAETSARVDVAIEISRQKLSVFQ